MDLMGEWYYRTFLDAGEFRIGLCKDPLKPLRDCPEKAVFENGYFIMQDGKPAKISNAFCLFELCVGDIPWRHILSSSTSKSSLTISLTLCSSTNSELQY
ncbi:unnamed protein product [Fraxinus pennsylvanica]|uniref:Amine oxidase n=1 Tax=Fraxinus pennsylvanica TaxID=56036 RepID=A0AAD1ZV39_9LAMI|nr:unnamed protein product [Fraxinus pennsylvanica]